jgi:Domain of Unknown Function with PDB structure (DUF3857)/Transglutaminase-like superfamily
MKNRSFSNPALPLPTIESSWFRVPAAGAVIIFFVLALTPRPAFAGDAPAWMHALTGVPLPPHDEKTDAVLLYSEEILTVQPNGKLKEIDRTAYKILRPGGKEFGKVILPFDAETRITNIHGWCIPAQGKDFEVKDKDVTERGMVDVEGGELMSNLRAKVMSIPASEPGNIVGYEVEHEDRPYVLQDDWRFQKKVPVAEARYTLQLPQGWEFKALWVNHPEISPTPIGNNQWQWILKGIPEIKPEQSMPPWWGVSSFVIVNLIPPGGSFHGFLSWSEMGVWQNQLLQGRFVASPAIKQKVAELTAKTSSPDARMRILAEFLQKDIRYVGIELGIGGWQPHPAQDTFTNRYGDCKDKATLLSSMLREVGIDSYLVLINTERGSITPATPPLLGFDHAILAIRVPQSIVDPSLVAILNHPKLGRLLIFDPTDEITPFGELRGALQASYALLVAPDTGELIQVPQLPPSANSTVRVAKLTLDPRGTLSGNVHETRVGDSAWYQRMTLRYVEKDSDRIKPIESLMSHSMGTFQITKATVINQKQNSLPFAYDWSFVALDYGKTAGDLLLVRPRVIGSHSSGILETREPRKYPVEFEGPRRDTDNFEIKIPTGFVVDELPPSIDAEYSFGSYHSKTEAVGDSIRYTRTVEIKELSVPVSKADDLKKFYRIIATDERNTAVLKPAAH